VVFHKKVACGVVGALIGPRAIWGELMKNYKENL